MAADAATGFDVSRVSAGLRPLFLLIGIAAAVAAGVGVVLWSQGTSYNLLYGNLSEEDAAAVTRALDGARIPYRLENGAGGVAVPADKLNEARLLLAGQGLPESGGFASMSKEPGFGVSQFMESARYQHALESELARTITSLQTVDGARVHIAAPRASSFVRDRQPARASVFLQVKPGRRLSGEQVQAIVNLVASGVPELDVGDITVIDQQGRLLSAPRGDDALARRDQQMEIARQLEEGYAQRIEALIAPLVGVGRVRAQVSAELDMSAVEEAREQYRPDSQIVRSEQISEESSRTGGTGAAGVPGALTNQPPPAGVAQPPGAQPARPGAAAGAVGAEGAAVASPDNLARQQTRNFEIDRTVAYTTQPAGRLRRLTVAVLLDNVRVVGADGKVTETPVPPEQIERITNLVRNAIGFDEQRGDSVSVVNDPWKGDPLLATEPVEELPIWQQPWAREIARIAAGLLLAIIVIFAVLKPLLKQLLGGAAPAAAARRAPDPAGGGQPPDVRALPPSAVAPAPVAQALSGPNLAAANATLAYEQQVAQARSMVAQDPARVAQVVKGWVAKDG